MFPKAHVLNTQPSVCPLVVGPQRWASVGVRLLLVYSWRGYWNPACSLLLCLFPGCHEVNYTSPSCFQPWCTALLSIKTLKLCRKMNLTALWVDYFWCCYSIRRLTCMHIRNFFLTPYFVFFFFKSGFPLPLSCFLLSFLLFLSFGGRVLLCSPG